MFIILSNKLDKKTAGKVVVKGTEYNELSDVGMELGKPGLFGCLFPGILGALPDFIGGVATAITNDLFGDRTEYSARHGFDGAFYLGRTIGHSVQLAVGIVDIIGGALALMAGNMATKNPAGAVASVAVSAEVKTVAVGLGAYGYKTVDEAVAAIKGDYAMYSTTRRNRNYRLAGGVHPKTKVPFDKDGYPVFKSKFDAELPAKKYQSTDKTQFKECNSQLKEAIEKDPAIRGRFNKDEIADIEKGITPDGYSWHHHQDTGKMQLVNEKIHADTGHSGGRNTWGGGTSKR